MRSEILDEAASKIINSKDNSLDFYLSVIREIGLHDDGRNIYHEDNKYINPLSGLWQNPFQFASLLSFLSNQDIKTYCEIGTFKCWATFIISVVLKKRNDVIVTGVDIFFKPDDYIYELFSKYQINFDHIIGSSNILKDNCYDLAFIDADHSYAAVKTDWENVGQFSKICLFHDIDDCYVKNGSYEKNGPRIFFDQLKKNKIMITYKEPIMGIGIVFNS